MKRIILALLIICAVEPALAQSVESRIREFAAQEYPNNSQMQQYVYDKQISAYRYMRSVKDSDVKDIAASEYPTDYAMQKYTCDKQLSAKRDLATVPDREVEQIALREYPTDYSMQKYTCNYSGKLSTARPARAI